MTRMNSMVPPTRIGFSLLLKKTTSTIFELTRRIAEVYQAYLKAWSARTAIEDKLWHMRGISGLVSA
jgi:hypothetical protein